MTNIDIPYFMMPSSWDMVIQATQDMVAKKRLHFVPCVESFISGSNSKINKDWFGFLHTPMNAPEWWNEVVGTEPYNTKAIFGSTMWQKNKSRCKGLITFSKTHAQQVTKNEKIAVTWVKYPLMKTEDLWSWNTFINNPQKKIIQLGWWMQRMHAIYILEKSDYEKIYIKNFSSYANEVFERERQILKERNMFFDFMDESVSLMEHASREDWSHMLKNNIAFAHYYDANIPSLVLDCIATTTPILVNPLPSVIEYLGRDYPLYYYSYVDAMVRIKNVDLIHKAHNHLIKLKENEELQLDHFLDKIQYSLEKL